MVLKNDDLSTIVVAISDGRTIFDNIRKFVVYLLSCNMGEVLVVAIAAAVGAPLPLLPLQILFLNLVTDVFPALALSVGDASDNVMSRPPRASSDAVVTSHQWRAIAGYGVVMTASVLTALVVALEYLGLSDREAVSVSFLTLAFGQTWHVFNMRRAESPLWRNEITKDPWIWAALVLCVGLLLLATYFPPLASLLSLEPPSVDAWFVILTMSLVPLLVGQCVKVGSVIVKR